MLLTLSGAYLAETKILQQNKLQKLEDALVEQMLTAADLADRGARVDQGDHGDWGDRRNGRIC